MRRYHLLTLLLLFSLIGCSSPIDLVDITATALANDVSDIIASPTATKRRPTATVVPTKTPLPTPTLKPTDTPKPTATPSPTATATPRPTNTPVPPTITPTATATPLVSNEIPEQPWTVVGVTLDDVLNVRAAPDASADIVATLAPSAQNIAVTGEARSVDAAMWVPVMVNGVSGWVNSGYLAEQQGTLDDALIGRAIGIMIALRDRDMSTLATYVHPEKGIRFVPMTVISDENSPFLASELPALLDSDRNFVWGSDYMMGGLIEMTFGEYYDRFLYSADFFYPDRVGYDVNLRTGTLIDNSRDIYPDAHIVEYHFDGFDEAFGGLDYRTLRLVFDQLDGESYLVAIVHNEWSP